MTALGPAAFWAVGVPAASNATDTNLFDAMMPSLPESAMLGLMMRSHTHGLQSGGLVGYSTFFTGYNPQQAGFFRSISVGRLAAQGVSATAQALHSLTPLGNSATVSPWLRRLSQTHRIGIAGALTAIDRGEFDAMKQTILAAGERARTVAHQRRSWVNGPGVRARTPEQIDELANYAARRAERRAYTQALKSGRGGKLWTWLAGVLGGVGFDESGRLDTKLVFDKDLDAYIRQAKANSTGAVWKHPAGRLLGKMARFGAGLEIAMLATDALVDAAGSTYGSLVRTTRLLQDRLAVDHRRMSSGYFSQAAATERQRAVMELNESVLNPRTQLMGQEAAFFHR